VNRTSVATRTNESTKVFLRQDLDDERSDGETHGDGEAFGDDRRDLLSVEGLPEVPVGEALHVLPVLHEQGIVQVIVLPHGPVGAL
jgi:hypothetical protein